MQFAKVHDSNLLSTDKLTGWVSQKSCQAFANTGMKTREHIFGSSPFSTNNDFFSGIYAVSTIVLQFQPAKNNKLWTPYFPPNVFPAPQAFSSYTRTSLPTPSWALFFQRPTHSRNMETVFRQHFPDYPRIASQGANLSMQPDS